MKRRKTGCLCLALAILFSCLAGGAQVSAATAPTAATIESAEATTMHLEKIQGTVEIADGDKSSIFAREGMQLYSGYALETAKESLAWISLDKTKAVKLDVLSGAQVKQQGKDLEITLTKGSLFFDISQPLEADESLNVRTSTMVMGIRGTCGWVSILNEDILQIALLEGSVDVQCTDLKTGEPRSVTVGDGQILTLVQTETAGEDALDILAEQDIIDGENVLYEDTGLCLEGLKEIKIPDFAGQEVADSPALQSRIAEKSTLSVQAILSSVTEEPETSAPKPAATTSAAAEDEVIYYAPPITSVTPSGSDADSGSGDTDIPSDGEAPEDSSKPEEDIPEESTPEDGKTDGGEEGDDGNGGEYGSGDDTTTPPEELIPYSKEWWDWIVANMWDWMADNWQNWGEDRPSGLPDYLEWPPTKKDPDTTPQPDTNPETNTGTEDDANTDSTTSTDTSTDTDTNSGTDTNTDTDTDTATDTDTNTDTDTDTNAIADTGTDTITTTDPGAEADNDADSASNADPLPTDGSGENTQLPPGAGTE